MNNISAEDERTKKVIEQTEYYKYLGFLKDIVWVKDDEEDFIILKDDIYNYIFDNDPIYYNLYKNKLSFKILKEEYNNIMSNARKNEHKKYNKISYTYLKTIRDID